MKFEIDDNQLIDKNANKVIQHLSPYSGIMKLINSQSRLKSKNGKYV